MNGLLDAIRPLRILVIGEAISDVYYFCTPIGISQKDAIVTWKQHRREDYEGGAMACANHLADFCRSVGLITQEWPLVKQRYLFDPFGTKVFAVETLAISAREIAMVERQVQDVAMYDVVIMADYGHGLLDSMFCWIASSAKFVAVMAQSNSGNFGFNLVTRYPRADYVCLDEVELRLAMQDRTGPIEPLADKLRHLMDAKMLAVTLGHRGCLTVDALGQTMTPALSHDVVDRIGAGDAFFSITAPCVALGATREQIGRIGNAAGAIAVRTMGNKAPVTRAELEAMLVQ